MGRRLAAAAMVILLAAGCGDSVRRTPPSPTPSCPAPTAAPPGVWVAVPAAVPAAAGVIVSVAADGRGRIVAAGSDRVFAFDTSTLVWTDLPRLADRQQNAVLAAAADGTVYAVGGSGLGGFSRATAVVSALAPGGQWTALPPMPVPRYLPALAVAANRLMVIGGADTTGGALPTADAFDPATRTWHHLAPMPLAASNPVAVVEAAGRVAVIGGTPAAGGGTAVQVYDPQRDTWSPAPALPVALQEFGAARTGDGRLVVAGGRDAAGHPAATVEVLDPATGAWTSGPALDRPRVDPGLAAGPDGRIYAIGGDVITAATVACAVVGTVEAARL